MTVIRPRTGTIVLAAAFLMLAFAPAASSAGLDAAPADESLWDYEGMQAFAEELRATTRTPAELEEIDQVLRYLERNPEEVAAWLAETPPPPRETKDAEGKDDGGFSLLRTDDRSKPVLMVHGRDNYDMGGYADLRNYYLNAGFSAVHRVGYYGGECNVEYRAEHHGSHNDWYGGSGEHSSKTGCTGGSSSQVHDLNTDIRHIAYHFAWLVHDHFGASGVTVDMLGHSMGGLLMRYAIAKSGSGGVWPPALRAEDATTMGTPHDGLGGWCWFSPWSDVRQMCSGSSFMSWMRSYAQDPQGYGGTDWTLMGSDCDEWVAWDSAVGMEAAHKVVYVSPCYGHSDYYKDVSTLNDATADYMDRPDPNWYRWSSAPHSGKWTNYAATYGTW